MGLVSRVVEAAGIPTVTLNMIWVYHRLIGMPRVAAIEHPFGRPYGDVGDVETQAGVLRAALAVFDLASLLGSRLKGISRSATSWMTAAFQTPGVSSVVPPPTINSRGVLEK